MVTTIFESNINIQHFASILSRCGARFIYFALNGLKFCLLRSEAEFFGFSFFGRGDGFELGPV